MTTYKTIRRLFLVGGLVAVGVLLFSPTTAEAQTEAIWACYIPKLGVIYLINPPDSPGENPDTVSTAQFKVVIIANLFQVFDTRMSRASLLT